MFGVLPPTALICTICLHPRNQTGELSIISSPVSNIGLIRPQPPLRLQTPQHGMADCRSSADALAIAAAGLAQMLAQTTLRVAPLRVRRSHVSQLEQFACAQHRLARQE